MFKADVSGDLLGDLEGITRRLTADQRTLARKVATAGRKAVVGSVRARRGSVSISGMNTKLGARSRVSAGAGSATVYLDAVPAGAWVIAERGRAEVHPVARDALHWGGVFAESARATSGRPGLWAGAEGDLADAVLPVLEQFADDAFGGP